MLKLDSFHDISKTRLANFSLVQEHFFSSKNIFIRSLTFILVYLISKIIALYQNSSRLVFCRHFFFVLSNTPIFCDYSSHLFCERVPCVAAIVLMLSAFFFRENFINSSFSHPNSWGPYIFIVATRKKNPLNGENHKKPSSILATLLCPCPQFSLIHVLTSTLTYQKTQINNMSAHINYSIRRPLNIFNKNYY